MRRASFSWRKQWRAFRFYMRMIFLGPLFSGVAIMYFLAVVPQAREVYLGIFEGRQYVQGLAGVCLLILLSLLLLTWQSLMATHAIDRMYVEHASLHFDRRLLRVRDWCSFTSFILPLVGLFLGLALLRRDVAETQLNLEAAVSRVSSSLPPDRQKSLLTDFVSPLSNVAPYLLVFAVITAAAIGLLFWVARRRRRQLVRSRVSLRYAAVGLGTVVSVATVAAPLLLPSYVVGGAQAIGPLASVALVLIVLVCVGIALSYLSHILRFPVFGTVVVALIGYFAVQTYAAMQAQRQAQVSTAGKDVSTADELAQKFSQWFDARAANYRQQFEPKGQRYPVFIVAAQGGGIYAASSAAMFLAAMQDRCRHFSQHIFAVSGVSGGAVGAALFAELQEGREVGPEGKCHIGDLKDRTNLKAIEGIALQDHLSPALGLIWPDVVRKFQQATSLDRSSVVERSFVCGFESGSVGLACPLKDNSKWLDKPYRDHWDPRKAGPALVLNTTWVETGLRAAFAPFSLKAAGEGTLYSFHRPDAKPGDFAAGGIDLLEDLSEVSTIEAAFVSARFPGLTPAWSVKLKDTDKRWNFVDGGYFDNAGAATALDIARALRKHPDADKVDIYLVLLTDAIADTDLRDIEGGTTFNDTVAPVTALLRVREQLANRAVSRAIGEMPSGRVLIVNLNQRTFTLPLGWKISGATNRILRLMLGQPDLCRTEQRGGDVAEGDDTTVKDVVKIIRTNSCVKRRLQELIDPSSVTPQTGAAAAP